MGELLDVTEVDQAEDFAAAVEARHGPVSILVNNAGNTVKKSLAEMTVEDFKSVVDVHVTGAFALSRAFLPQIKNSGRGSMLFTASMSSFLGIPFCTGYAASKAAYVGMVRSFATELAPQGVRVNGVAPGWIDTPAVPLRDLEGSGKAAKDHGPHPHGQGWRPRGYRLGYGLSGVGRCPLCEWSYPGRRRWRPARFLSQGHSAIFAKG